jgi:acetyl-CoA/propionyl-CoA carboxylase biotin carboxyl carrier protein
VIHESAKAICLAGGYTGAGTVEYLVGQDGTVSFLEVNTRLQVEHPVTEETAGVDLVQEQFRIAAGATLRSDVDPAPRGHAIEFRINSEDPGQGFLPVPGTLTRYLMPSGPGIRVDSGVEQGSVVDGRFDSMLAKLIVTGVDRDDALRRSRRALAELAIEGVPTPVPLYRLIVDDPAYVGDGRGFRVHNRWIETEFDGHVEAAGSPLAPDEVSVRVGRRVLAVGVPGLAELGERAGGIRADAACLRAREQAPEAADAVVAPMQGTIVQVAVQDGQQVSEGELIAVLEAMKMENRVLAHRDGKVAGLGVTVGDNVAQRSPLCRIAAGDDS